MGNVGAGALSPDPREDSIMNLKYVSCHQHVIEDKDGEAVAVVNFCSNYCHTEWCSNNNVVYKGWNGAQEIEYDADEEPGGPLCASCEEELDWTSRFDDEEDDEEDDEDEFDENDLAEDDEEDEVED
jgi:hypothetical protein